MPGINGNVAGRQVGQMVKVGLIGYGSMGSMLVSALIMSGTLTPDEIIVSTRTKSKLDALKNQWSNINIARDNTEVAKQAKYIFVCVKALEMKDVILEIRSCLAPGSIIVSTAGAVKLRYIEELSHVKAVKLIPSITSEVYSGISLICFGNDLAKADTEFIETILNSISRVKIVNEADIGFATELTSCMPGFIAEIFKEMSDSAKLYESSLADHEIDEMIISTLYGTAKLLFEKRLSFDDTVSRVATKGGITEEGTKVLDSGLPAVFNEMFEVTLNKRKAVVERTDNLFKL